MIRKLLIIFGVFALVPALALVVANQAFAATVRIVVPAHDINRGDTISESDLIYATVDGAQLTSGRTLAAGQAFRSDDVRRPIVILKGQTVTMEFEAPGVELTAMGRAMSEGGVGDTVTIQNPASYRMISGVVIAPGVVRATGIIAGLSNTLARR
jgi:flagella basal body P-ring formation protein FlgA